MWLVERGSRSAVHVSSPTERSCNVDDLSLSGIAVSVVIVPKGHPAPAERLFRRSARSRFRPRQQEL